jgi:hypothetical protein
MLHLFLNKSRACVSIRCRWFVYLTHVKALGKDDDDLQRKMLK